MRTFIWTISLVAVSAIAAAQGDGAKFSVETKGTGRPIPFHLPLQGSLPKDAMFRADGGADLDVPLTVIGSKIFGVLPSSTPAGVHDFVLREVKYKGEPNVNITQN